MATPARLDTSHSAAITDAERLAAAESRLAAIEAKILKFEQSMLAAGKLMVENPMFSMMMPKEMKTALREFFEL